MTPQWVMPTELEAEGFQRVATTVTRVVELWTEYKMNNNLMPLDRPEKPDSVVFWKDRIQRGEPVEMPHCYFIQYEGLAPVFDFRDGRHRLSALVELGIEDLVIAVGPGSHPSLVAMLGA